MSRSIHDQTLALAGVFQASALVQQIAHSGQCAESSFETCLRSLFATQPETTLDVFGGELKDPLQGLVDFRTLADGREVYLCWREGEDSIEFWHEIDTGFGGRQPL